MLGSLAGDISKLLVVVAVSGMPEDDFYVADVAGLSNTCEVGGSGYLMFIKKRGGNLKSNKWKHKNFLIPEIEKSDKCHESLIGNGT